uniref:Peptidase S1 domain-containing protein n=1 Tax=Bionectria ochroleuca TaxID=29856 RepID=A0A8H7N5B8_BIOOC
MAPTLAVAAALLLPLAAAVPVDRTLPGQVRDDVTTMIVGGTEASTGEFPYIVSLSEGGSHFCGGVLINANTVATAGHCSYGTSASSVRVRAGSNSRSSGGTQVSVSSILIHSGFDYDTLDNDISLWRLSTAISEGTNIKYATLPTQGSDPADGTILTVAGWGTTSSGGSSLPTNLRKVSVPVIQRSECSSDYSSLGYDVTSNMFCAAEDAGGKDSCQGDSGGPIVNSAAVLQGLVSWGVGCAQAAYPGVYTRVGNYVSWINSNKW